MRDINTLHPYLKHKAEELKAEAALRLNLRIIITECLRSAAEQSALYAQGRLPLDDVNRARKTAGLAPITQAQNKIVTKAPTAESSYHGYGLAFDIAITDPSGRKIEWSDKSDWNDDDVNDWLQVGELGIQLGLDWGGNWTSFPDIPHYQYTFGRTIKSLKADPNVVAGQTIYLPYDHLM